MRVEDLAQYNIDSSEIQYHLEKFRREECIIAVTGEFNSGKSRLINCLLGKQDFLPYGRTECTAVLVDIRAGEERQIGLLHLDGSEEQVDYSAENIEEYVRFDRKKNHGLLSVEIPVADMRLGNGVHIIDTPGTNTIWKEQEALTRYILKKADLVIYAFDRSLGKSDMEQIGEIRKYTGDILFVMTHIDEIEDKTGEADVRGKLGSLMSEAKEALSRQLNCEKEDILLFPVDCVRGLEDREYVDAVLHCVEEYLSSQSGERRRRNVRRRISSVILDGIRNLEMKAEFLSASRDKAQCEIQDKIRDYEAKKEQAEDGYERITANLNSQMEREKENCLIELNHRLTENREKIGAVLLEGDIDETDVRNRLDGMNRQTSLEIRGYVEKSICRVMDISYEEARTELEELVKEFKLDIPLHFGAPEIKDLDYSRLAEELADIDQQIKENLAALQKLEKDSGAEKAEEIRRQIETYKEEYDNVKNGLLQLGAYRPQYDLVEEAGGKQGGKLAGRILGEIADVGLFFWNPAAGAGAVSGAAKAAKAADKAKDMATIVRYLKNTLGAVKKADTVRREVMDNVKGSEPVGEEGAFSKLLDYLSIGYWAEKAGGAIGEKINPTRRIQVENEEVREQYNRSRDAIVQKCNEMSSKIVRLEEELEENNDYGRERRIRKAIEETQKALEEEKERLEKEKQREEENYRSTREKEHYSGELTRYFETLKTDGEKLIGSIYDRAGYEILGKLTESYYKKLKELDEMVSGLSEKKEVMEKEIQKCHTQIGELSDYEHFIEAWLVK